MPVVTLTDITLRSLRPTPGKQVTYIDKSLKGFGVRVNERGMSYVLPFGPGRQRIKIANVGVIPLKDARTKAKTILAEKQLGIAKPEAAPSFDEAKPSFSPSVRARTSLVPCGTTRTFSIATSPSVRSPSMRSPPKRSIAGSAVFKGPSRSRTTHS